MGALRYRPAPTPHNYPQGGAEKHLLPASALSVQHSTHDWVPCDALVHLAEHLPCADPRVQRWDVDGLLNNDHRILSDRDSLRGSPGASDVANSVGDGVAAVFGTYAAGGELQCGNQCGVSYTGMGCGADAGDVGCY